MKPLAFGEVLDMGYGEIAVTAAYAEVLINGAMTHLNGEPVSLKIVDRGLTSIGAVIVRVTRLEAPAAALELAA